MQITLTEKLQICPDENTKEILINTMHVYKEACNYVSMYVFSTQEIRLKELQQALYYKLRNIFNIRSQMAISVLRTVRARYITIDANRQPWTLVRFSKPQLDLVWNRDYSLLGDLFSINTLEGRKKMRYFNHKSPLVGKFGTARLIYRHNKFYLQIPITREIPDISERDIINVVGVDRGIRFVATAYDRKGKTTFFSGSRIKDKRTHFARVRKQLKQKRTPSSRKRLASIGRREHRWMQDVNHCISKALTESQPRGTMFVLEDLKGIISRIRRSGLYDYSAWTYYDLEEKIIYKAALRGQLVIKVDPAYTSQTCPLCGRISKSSRIRSRHLFRCTFCRYKSNDDRVAAINLYSKGIQYLVQSGASIALFGGA